MTSLHNLGFGRGLQFFQSLGTHPFKQFEGEELETFPKFCCRPSRYNGFIRFSWHEFTVVLIWTFFLTPSRYRITQHGMAQTLLGWLVGSRSKCSAPF